MVNSSQADFLENGTYCAMRVVADEFRYSFRALFCRVFVLYCIFDEFLTDKIISYTIRLYFVNFLLIRNRSSAIEKCD